MKEKQSKGVLRCVQVTAGDIEISEKQTLASVPDTKKKPKVIASPKQDMSKNAIKGAALDADHEEKIPHGPPVANPTEESDGNPRRSIKNLAGFWSASSAQPGDVKSFRKKRFHVDEGPDNTSPCGDELERIIRADDVRAEHKPQIEISEGHAKGIASMFLNKSLDSTSTSRSVRLDKEFASLDEGFVADVESKSVNPLSSTKLRRRIKDIAGTFSSVSTDEDIQSMNEKRTGVDGELNTANSEEPVVLEKGRTRGLADRWQQQHLGPEQESSLVRSATDDVRAKPAWLIELEMAKELEPVVYENEPVVRDDVIRADDETPDVISARVTREARQKWSTIEKDEIKKKDDSQLLQASVVKSKAAVQTPQFKTTSVDDADDDDEKTAVVKSEIVDRTRKQENKISKNIRNEKNKADKEAYVSGEREDEVQVKDNKTDDIVNLVQNVHTSHVSKCDKVSSEPTSEFLKTISQPNDDDSDDEGDEDEEDIDKYFTEGESGLVLSGAVLIHIPRKKLLHSLCD